MHDDCSQTNGLYSISHFALAQQGFNLQNSEHKEIVFLILASHIQKENIFIKLDDTSGRASQHVYHWIFIIAAFSDKMEQM